MLASHGPRRQEQDRPDEEADRADERAEVRDLGVPDVVGGGHDVAGHRRDAEGDGTEQVRHGDPPDARAWALRRRLRRGRPSRRARWPRGTQWTPNASGRHTRWSSAAASRLTRTAFPVLQLNHSVPANCTAQASQSMFRGAHTQKRRSSASCDGREVVDRLAVLQERRRREEQRADEEREGGGPQPGRFRVERHRAEPEEGGADDEQDRDPPACGCAPRPDSRRISHERSSEAGDVRDRAGCRTVERARGPAVTLWRRDQ